MADHANPLEGRAILRWELAQAPTQKHTSDPFVVKSEAETLEGFSLREGRQATPRANDETAPKAPSTACGSCRRPLENCENQGIENSNGANKKIQRAKTRVGRIHDSKEDKLRFASTRARKNENAAHTWTGARFQGTGKPILPSMAESMNGPLKIVPSLKREHHFKKSVPILQREHHFRPPRA